MVKLTEVRDLGKEVDRQRRADVRKPTHQLLRVVKKARKEIFKGYKVTGTRVEKQLEGGSRVPTKVGRPSIVPPPLRG